MPLDLTFSGIAVTETRNIKNQITTVKGLSRCQRGSNQYWKLAVGSDAWGHEAEEPFQILG